ncbi:MAG TPA: DUF4260 domain-containing protein [Gaiellaceae bacterium]
MVTAVEATAVPAQSPATSDLPDGTVVGTPRRLLRAEAAVLVVGVFIAYSQTGQSWWLVPLTVLLPDLTMIGYAGGARLGSRLYNLGHSTPLPAAIVAIGWWQEKSLPLALGLIWLAHIGLDRVLGYGLKYADHFQHTHLGWLRQRRPEL